MRAIEWRALSVGELKQSAAERPRAPRGAGARASRVTLRTRTNCATAYHQHTHRIFSRCVIYLYHSLKTRPEHRP